LIKKFPSVWEKFQKTAGGIFLTQTVEFVKQPIVILLEKFVEGRKIWVTVAFSDVYLLQQYLE